MTTGECLNAVGVLSPMDSIGELWNPPIHLVDDALVLLRTCLGCISVSTVGNWSILGNGSMQLMHEAL